jgi:hypothetical protein
VRVRLRKVSLVFVIAVVVILTGSLVGGELVKTPRAEAQTPPFWQVFSPLAGTRTVTSPTRFHNQCAATPLFDSPDFDNGTCQASLGGDWSADIDAAAGATAYIDLQAADGTTDFRVRAGARGSYTPSGCWAAGPKYQYFNIDYWNGSAYVAVGWIVLGHINPSHLSGTTIGTSSGGRIHLPVGTVASSSCPHVHMEFYNSSYWAVAHDWDGPSNANDANSTPACVTSGTESDPSGCNARIDGNWIIGHLGGWAGFFHEMPNPYYNATPDF